MPSRRQQRGGACRTRLALLHHFTVLKDLFRQPSVRPSSSTPGVVSESCSPAFPGLLHVDTFKGLSVCLSANELSSQKPQGSVPRECSAWAQHKLLLVFFYTLAGSLTYTDCSRIGIEYPLLTWDEFMNKAASSTRLHLQSCVWLPDERWKHKSFIRYLRVAEVGTL